MKLYVNNKYLGCKVLKYSMLKWSFEKMLHYIADDLDWNDIKPDDVETIKFECKEENFEYEVKRNVN